jgi:hypothetical protein
MLIAGSPFPCGRPVAEAALTPADETTRRR